MTQNPENFQPYQPQPPAQFQSPYVVQEEPKGLSIASMVLGLCSIFFGLVFFVPIVGFVLGIMGLRKEPAGKGMAIAGIVLNGLFLVMWLLVIVAFLSFLSLVPVMM